MIGKVLWIAASISLLFLAVLVLNVEAMPRDLLESHFPATINAFTIHQAFDIINGLAPPQHPSAQENSELDEVNQHLNEMTANTTDEPLSASPNISKLKQMAAYSSIARCLSEKVTSVTNWSCTWCKNGYVPALKSISGDVSGAEKLGWYVGYSPADDHILVVWKSTGGLENWIINLTFDKIDYNVQGCPGCKVHKGFLAAYKATRNLIFTAIKKASNDNKCKRVAFTGHSQGAALVTHAAIDFSEGLILKANILGLDVFYNTDNHIYNDITLEQLNQFSAMGLNSHPETPEQQLATLNAQDSGYKISYPIYTFGSPRVGCQAFSDFYNKATGGPTNTFRVTHRADTVPHVPLKAMGFIHVGNEIWFNQAGTSMEYKQCSTQTTEDKTCSDSQAAILVLDHKWYGGYSMLQEPKDCN